MPDAQTPQGVVAILTAPDGHVVAVAHDFEPSHGSDFDRKERQEFRARSLLEIEVVRAFCSPPVARAIEPHHRQSILRDLTRKQGYRVHLHAIGYNDA